MNPEDAQDAERADEAGDAKGARETYDARTAAARPHDPVLAHRARLAATVKIGQRVGYLLFVVAMVAFFVGLARGFDPTLVTIVEVGLIVGSIVLAPSIVLSYAVKAAEKEERGEHPG